MQLLLDTHILSWVLEGGSNLPTRAKKLIRDSTNKVIISTITRFEIAIKIKIGKCRNRHRINECTIYSTELTSVLSIQLLPILPQRLDAYQTIPFYDDHRDPFDRLLIATALSDKYTLLSIDSKFERYSSLISLVQ